MQIGNPADLSSQARSTFFAMETKKVEEPLHKRVIKRAELIRKRWKDIPKPAAVRKAKTVGRKAVAAVRKVATVA